MQENQGEKKRSKFIHKRSKFVHKKCQKSLLLQNKPNQSKKKKEKIKCQKRVQGKQERV